MYYFYTFIIYDKKRKLRIEMTSLLKIKNHFFAILFFLFFGCAQPQSTLPVYNEQLSIEEQKIQNQLFAESWLNVYVDFSNIGYGILFSASDLCAKEDQIYDIGLDVATKYEGPENIREEIIKILGLNENLKVIAIGNNSPASKAGFLKGDEIIKINNLNAPSGETASSEFNKMMSMDYASNYNFIVLRGSTQFPIDVKTSKRCRFNYMVDLDNNNFNAFADGNNMFFSLRIAKWLLQDDIGVAIVFSHELGHNANHHIEDKKSNATIGAGVGLLAGILLGGDIGQAQDLMDIGANIGASQYSVEYENEADYLSLYVLAHSGFNIDEAVNFWRRFAVEVPDSIYSTGGSHPSTSERYIRMEATIKEIKSKIRNGEDLLPSYNVEQ